MAARTQSPGAFHMPHKWTNDNAKIEHSYECQVLRAWSIMSRGSGDQTIAVSAVRMSRRICGRTCFTTASTFTKHSHAHSLGNPKAPAS